MFKTLRDTTYNTAQRSQYYETRKNKNVLVLIKKTTTQMYVRGEDELASNFDVSN